MHGHWSWRAFGIWRLGCFLSFDVFMPRLYARLDIEPGAGLGKKVIHREFFIRWVVCFVFFRFGGCIDLFEGGGQ